MAKIVRNKEQITASVTPYLKKRCIEIAKGPDFTSISDIVTQALSEFITKYDERIDKEITNYENDLAKAIFLSLKQSKEGNDFIESFFKSNQEPFIEMEESKNQTNSKSQEFFKTLCGSYKKNVSSGE
jgi:hypothetical protein